MIIYVDSTVQYHEFDSSSLIKIVNLMGHSPPAQPLCHHYVTLN